jgi:hypothetical protein
MTQCWGYPECMGCNECWKKESKVNNFDSESFKTGDKVIVVDRVSGYRGEAKITGHAAKLGLWYETPTRHVGYLSSFQDECFLKVVQSEISEISEISEADEADEDEDDEDAEDEALGAEVLKSLLPGRTRNPKDIVGAAKPDLSLVPPVSTLHEAMAMELGAKKYGPYNFRATPVEAMTYIAAAMRHIQNWLDGEEYTADAEKFGLVVHNLGAAKAGLGILLDCLERRTLVDNRPPAGSSSAVQERMQAKKKEMAK